MFTAYFNYEKNLSTSFNFNLRFTWYCIYTLHLQSKMNCTHFLKIGLVVAQGGFYVYYIHQGNTSDKERKLLEKKVLCIQKDLLHF